MRLYWGLRKYSGLPDLIWGGDSSCEHQWLDATYKRRSSDGLPGFSKERYDNKTYEELRRDKPIESAFCSLCGAWKGQLGLEPTPEMYIDHLVEICREIRRVLRRDGVFFLNIGDSYASGFASSDNKYKAMAGNEPKQKFDTGLKPKDLCLIPFRLAIALQDGWWVRSVIIWSKPNPMPESVRDRPTESHEYILMLTKSARYYWDQETVREPQGNNTHSRGYGDGGKKQRERTKEGTFVGFKESTPLTYLPSGRNLRSVWIFPTRGFSGAHFAVFPEKLPEICIKAATPEVGCCSKCGAPWERIVESKRTPDTPRPKDALNLDRNTKGEGWITKTQTLGWQPTCSCKADKTPSVCLDPFAGSGTTLLVASKLGRKSIGYELSEEYCRLIVERNRQSVFEVR